MNNSTLGQIPCVGSNKDAVISKVKEQVTETDKTISEIAFDLGFNYPHHLSRSFKKIVGITPGEFRLKAV